MPSVGEKFYRKSVSDRISLGLTVCHKVRQGCVGRSAHCTAIIDGARETHCGRVRDGDRAARADARERNGRARIRKWRRPTHSGRAAERHPSGGGRHSVEREERRRCASVLRRLLVALADRAELAGRSGAPRRAEIAEPARRFPQGRRVLCGGIWDSYREAYELFRPDGQRPVPFDVKQQVLPFCANVPAGTKVLLMGTKSGTLLQATSQSFSYPLVDQNLNYVYYEIRFNRDQYDFVRGSDKNKASWLYLAANLEAAESKAPISMPISAPQPYREGAVMLKAAWKQLAAPDPRYYTVPAVIYDPSSKQPCRKTLVGLIGFHIAHKVKDFPQWIWSSFEHVDNVPNDDGSHSGPMTLNNGKAEPKTDGGWANRPNSQSLVPKDKRVAAQVTRLNPIPTTPAGARPST